VVLGEIPDGAPRGHTRRLKAVATICAAAASALVLSDGEGSRVGAATNPRSDGIAFVRGYEIYVVSPDGSSVHKVARRMNGVPVTDPAWSSDRNWIAFMLFVKESDNEIGLVRPSGKDRRDGVFDFGLASGPAWSPDDKRLAVEQFVGGFPPPTDNSAIVVVPTQPPHEQLELTKYTHRDFSPAWSPNGRVIAFERETHRGAPKAIFTVPSAGGPAKRISRGGEPDWSPDGRWIALADRGNVYVVNRDGSGRRLLIGGTPIDGKPRWSPDGKKIAFVRARRPGCRAFDCVRDLWIADRAGRNQQLLVRNADSIDW
jgi:Tol biopolymer transport system component